MIIVNQDKDTIINFDNVESIYIFTNGTASIRAESPSDTTILGNYKTEERAKEVLQEIIERYEHTQYIKGFGREIDCYEVGIRDFTYEMPED